MRFVVEITGGIFPYSWKLFSATRTVCKSDESYGSVENATRDITAVKRMLCSPEVSAAEVVVPAHVRYWEREICRR